MGKITQHQAEVDHCKGPLLKRCILTRENTFNSKTVNIYLSVNVQLSLNHNHLPCESFCAVFNDIRVTIPLLNPEAHIFKVTDGHLILVVEYIY